MRRWLPSVLVVALAGCEGPSYFPQPAAAPSADPAPTAIAIVFSPPELPIGGGEAVVHLATTVGTGTAARARLIVTASEGELSTGEVTTDGTGHAKVFWRGTRSSVITAAAGDVQTSAEVRVQTPQTLPPMPPPQLPPPAPPVDPQPPSPPGPATVSVTLTATPGTVLIGQTVTFVATARTNAEAGAIRSYSWDLDGDGAFEITEGGPGTTTSYPTAGTRTVRVQATSASWARGEGTATVTVNAPSAPPAPAPSLTLSVTPNPVAVNTVTTFTAAVANLPAAETVTSYEWDFDTSVSGIDQVTLGPSATHQYGSVGFKTTKVRALTSTGRVLESAAVQVAVN
jgi:hypothetical protein